MCKTVRLAMDVRKTNVQSFLKVNNKIVHDKFKNDRKLCLLSGVCGISQFLDTSILSPEISRKLLMSRHFEFATI